MSSNTTSELREAIAAIMYENETDAEITPLEAARFLNEPRFEKLVNFVAAQKQRWEAEARLTIPANSIHEFLKTHNGMHHTISNYIDWLQEQYRTAALDGVLEEKQ